MSSHSTSKKPSSKSKKSSTSSAPISSSSTSKKRSTASTNPPPPPSERAKRSVVGNGKKSLREEELGVGQEIESEDASESGGGKGGKGKSRNLEEEEEEDEEDEESGDGGVTRCVCGDDNEEMSSGLMIQCDTCKCWQHGPCVGLWEEKECPNRYFCELCKPALHGPGGLLRKVSRKSSAPAARRATRSPSITTSHKGASTSTSTIHPDPPPSRSSKPRESLDSHHSHSHSHNDARSPSDEPPSKETNSSSKRKKSLGPPGPPPKKRSTMNSRDAAYDDAIALSILEAGGAARRDKLEGRERSDSESDEEDEGDQVEEKSEEEKEEKESEVREKGRKGTGAGKGKGGVTAKAGAKRNANTGGKGKSNGRASNARSKSEQSEQTSNLVVPKIEPEHELDEEQEARQAEEEEEEQGELEEPASKKKKRNISPELGRAEKESIVVNEEEREAETRVGDEDEEMRDVEGDAILGEGAEQVEEEEEAHEASPAPLPIPTIVAPPTTHHTTSRAKHPNQYTYRPKNGTTSAGPSTSTSTSTSSRNPRASPLKGRSHAKDDSSTLSVPSTTNSKSKSANLGGMTKSEKAEREREKKQWASELGIHLGWSMPEHLKHLGYLLPSQTPEPITVPTSASVYAATMQNGGGGGGGGSVIGGQYNPLQEYEELSSTFRPFSQDQEGGSSSSSHHFEPPHKVKFPAKRTTMPEMKKRIKSLGEYLDKIRQELQDREKKDEVLRRAIQANRMMKNGQGVGVGGGEDSQEMGLAVGGNQALGTSAISEGTLKFMDALGRELVMFQQRFDS